MRAMLFSYFLYFVFSFLSCLPLQFLNDHPRPSLSDIVIGVMTPKTRLTSQLSNDCLTATTLSRNILNIFHKSSLQSQPL